MIPFSEQCDQSGLRSRMARVLLCSVLLTAAVSGAVAQQEPVQPNVVRPGAPGQPTKTLPATTRARLTERSQKDVEFMQGMIHHHSQAVEMTDLIEARTENKNIRRLGARISASQLDEMNFMRRWLETRGEPIEMKMAAMPADHSHGHSTAEHEMLMPGMLSRKQIAELKKARGAEFDRLFLAGMIQHHEGALVMVKELHATAGAGQDAELFNFATDVDTGQRAEINIMRNMLGEIPVK
ncbi:MAG TPA: DUF305 domain-containing protein [Pyrinomonadaceae bacterium]|nr:DUF305 domain-containing protein [Pyrinomonadaceae bacterium]